MSKRRVHIDPKMPTKAAMAKHKDFDSLLKKHEAITKRPKYNAIKVITGIMLIAVVAALVFEAVEVEERGIQPPLSNHEIPFEGFLIDPEQRAEVVLLDGTTLKFPANALVNEKGQVPTSSVLVKARVFRNPMDFFLSGIPMTVDSAGKTFTFASAGMLEVEARDAQDELQLADGMSVQVSMPSDLDGTYGVYAFDTLSNQWMKQSKSRQEQAAPDTLIEATISDQGAVLTEQVSLIITADSVPMSLGDTCHDTTLKYEEPRPKTLNWKERAKRRRQQQIALEKQRRAAQQQLMQSFATQEEEFRKWAKQVDSINQAYQRQMKRTQQFIRSFEMSSLGIWNCDNPILNEFPNRLALTFVRDGAPYKPNCITYHVDQRQNALFKYYANTAELKFDAGHANVIWFAHSDDTVGVVDTAAFREATLFDQPFKVELLPADSAIAAMQKFTSSIRT